MLQTEKSPRIPFGINSTSDASISGNDKFGQSLRLAMACIQAEHVPMQGSAIPDDESSIRERLKALAQNIACKHADLLELLVKFDSVDGWKSSGAKNCAAWMNMEIGISTKLSWEYLRAGRQLRHLPTTRALFRAGSLSWSKVRLLTRVANADNEALLCHAALDASVSDVQRICNSYNWNEEEDNSEGVIDDKDAQALQQWDSRSLTWNNTSNGSTCISLVLPPELAQVFLNSVEHSLHTLESDENKLSQRRADAAVLMAENNLQHAGIDTARADRYQVIVSVDSSNVQPNDIPAKRPTIKNAGPIAHETAKRISCDCSISVHETANGEPINIGRKSRIWPKSMERAIKERDQHCIWPGCMHTRHLHIHHIKHWADGGETAVDNGACLCSHHHTLVHEGGYTVQHVQSNNALLNDQFSQQCKSDSSVFEFEEKLRNSRNSFDAVRMLSPTRYRFRIVDEEGFSVGCPRKESTRVDSRVESVTKETQVDYFNRVEIREPIALYCHLH